MAFSFSQTSIAQVDFGIKGGINYNSNSVKGVSKDVFSGSESKTGYHAGVWSRIKIPVLDLYVRPELVYTTLKNEVFYSEAATLTTNSFQKIDVPVLIGKNILGIGNVFIGPSFQYIIDSNFDIDAIKNVDASGFSMGLQFGGGIEFGKFGVDVRWERAFSDIESSYIGNLGKVTYDTRINQIIIGLSIEL